MKRTISSAQTFLMKIILPGIWIPFFGTAAFTAFRSQENSFFLGIWSLMIWVAGSVFIYWFGGRLKKVDVAGDSLIVSNYLKEISIPSAEIKDVTENRWINIHPVTIHLKNPSYFGSKIVFMPKTRIFAWFSSHPVVDELKDLAKSASFKSDFTR